MSTGIIKCKRLAKYKGVGICSRGYVQGVIPLYVQEDIQGRMSRRYVKGELLVCLRGYVHLIFIVICPRGYARDYVQGVCPKESPMEYVIGGRGKTDSLFLTEALGVRGVVQMVQV